MTREEAIEFLRSPIKCSDKGDERDLREAMDMAIKSLEQESCGDCISRQAAIDALTKTSGIRGDALKALYDLPSVTPAEKAGRWIDDKCSVCGKGIEDLIDSHEWYRNEQPNFCPFCGVKLVDSQESEVEE